MNEHMSIKQLAAYLDLPPETLYKYVRAGMIPAVKSGRNWVVSRDEIERWIEEHGNTAEAAHRGQILVVDDEPVIRHVFRTWLEDEGYRVAEACDGGEALALIDRESFDLVFLDLQMPGTNGVETLRKIRDCVAAQDVVIVTGHYDGAMMDEVLSMGPAHVLKKPVDKEQFIEAVRLYTAQNPVR